MKHLFSWLDRMPTSSLLFTALLLGLAPFSPEPHLVEKIRMLVQGQLTRAIDIFDLFLHGTPVLLLGVKLSRQGLKSRGKKAS